MADWIFASLTTAVVGIATTANQVQSTASYTVTDTNGTVSLGNFAPTSSTSAVPGILVGRRPQTGQVFPRGVYNK